MGYGLVLLLAGSFGGIYLLILGFLFGRRTGEAE